MFTVKAILLAQQPEIYEQLMVFFRSKVEEKKQHGVSDREIENLMRHDSYVRGRGGIKQIRRGS